MDDRTKRLKVDHDREVYTKAKDEKLVSFINWMKAQNINVSNKVYVSKTGTSSGYGLIAAENIEAGYCLIEIPRSAILWECNSSVKELVDRDLERLQSKSGWVPLLITLMCEYSNPQSRWRPYFDVVIDNSDELDLPMFWDSSSMKELEGTDLSASVGTDIKNMKEEFENFVLPFFKRHTELLSLGTLNFELYKKLTAFVMAYSFTEPQQITDESDEDEEHSKETKEPSPMMVPPADILNHIAKNNAELEFGASSLKMVSNREIAKDEEIFNTYGQLTNEDLLHMYGFAERYPNNHNDSVEISINILLHEYEKLNSANASKLAFIKSLGLINNEPFAIGVSGVLGEEHLERTLKILDADEDTLKNIAENEGWLSDEEENESDLFSNENLKNLPEKWRNLLIRTVEQRLLSFSTSLEKDEVLLNSTEKLSRRMKWALYTRYGQKMLLKKFIMFLNE